MNIWHIPEEQKTDDESKFLTLGTNKKTHQPSKKVENSLDKPVNQIQDANPHYVLGYN